MSPRDPFAFLDQETPTRKTLLLLLAVIKKQGGEISLSLEDLTSIEDGASFHKYPSDTGSSLVLRYARRGAEAYFLSATEEQPLKSKTISRSREIPSDSSEAPHQTPRHSVHSDIDLALREEEMATRAQNAQKERMRQARAEAGAMPWTTRQ